MTETLDTAAAAGPITTSTVGEGTATVTYDVRGDLAAATPEKPALFLLGSPMDASGFGTLAGHVTDRPVITYDPRGAGRNPTDTTPIPPEDHAGDLRAVIEAVQAAGSGPVDVFATSGGAVNVLALLAMPGADALVRRVVAHEPPIATHLPDREEALAACRAIRATYDAEGSGPAMARFIALVMHSGPVDEAYLAAPAPDPAAFGMSTEDDGSRTDPLMRAMVLCQEHAPDREALAAYGDRLVIATGAESGEEIAVRGARTVAAALGLEPTEFPSHHAGFLGGEFGQTGQPEAFAARLREVLA
jgi:pimeloyl-ACP methyl ester carboxylesterase